MTTINPDHAEHWVALDWCHDCLQWADDPRAPQALGQRDPGDCTY